MLLFFLPVLVAFVALFSPGPVSQNATITPEFLRGRLEVLKGIHGNLFGGLFARRNGDVSFGEQFISEASPNHIPRVSSCTSYTLVEFSSPFPAINPVAALALILVLVSIVLTRWRSIATQWLWAKVCLFPVFRPII